MSNCVKLGFENNPSHPYHQGHSSKHSPSHRIVHGKVKGLGHVEIHASSTRGHVIVPFAASIFKISSQLRLRTLPGLKSGIHTCWPNCLNKSLLAHRPRKSQAQEISALFKPDPKYCLGVGHFMYGSVVTPSTAPQRVHVFEKGGKATCRSTGR